MSRTWRYCVPALAGIVLAGCASMDKTAPEPVTQDDNEVPWEQVYEHTAPSFVIVSYHLKKSDRLGVEDAYLYGGEYGATLQRILNKNTLDVIGVIISDKGEILTFDKEPVYGDTVDRITVRGRDGTVVPARADRLLMKAPGRILRIEGAMPAGWKALAFTDLGAVGPQTELYAAVMAPDKQNHLYVNPCEYGLEWDDAAEPCYCLQLSSVHCVSVICDEQGVPVGVTCRDRIDLGPTGPAWRANDILADPGLTDEQQKKLEERLKQEFARNIYEIKIILRPEPREEEEYDFGGRFPYGARWRGGGGEGNQEVLAYGLAFAKDKLLIPNGLPKDFVAGIDTITVDVNDKPLPGRFAGVLKSCGATVIGLEQGELPRVASFAPDGRLARVAPFWAVFVREMAGMDVQVEPCRWIDEQQGYEDKWYPVMERPLLPGSWLLDCQANVVGFFGEIRHEYDRLEPYLLEGQGERYRMYAGVMADRLQRSAGPGPARRLGSRGEVCAFDAAEMAAMLANLPANYDEHIRHLSKDEQKRRVWLGVEYTTPDKEMVKQLDLREPTRDGRIGLVVNRVYADSPAARLGLAEGDVLLSITVPGAPWPIELSAAEGGDSEMPDFEEVDIPKEFEAMGYQMPRRRPWPSQDNYLTRMLADIGVGTTVKLGYLHDGRKQEQEFTIEQAPRDMLSAAKYKDEKLGLTVKDVTYEVRAALRLEPNEPAVVVTKVEEGTPAALARINTYELIRAIDGESVTDVEVFQKLITAAQQQNKESVRLTVEWMGKTRLADLKFETAAGPGRLRSLLGGQE
jgi:hypothetical protein